VIMKKVIIALAVLAGVAASLILFRHKAVAPPETAKQTANTAPLSNQVANPPFDKQKYSVDEPGSIWVVVNKPRPLKPIDYAPADLVVPDIPLRVPGNESMRVRQTTATALQQMFAAAKAESVNLMLSSGFRSYTYQTGLYNGYVKSKGQAGADNISARPGHSEHQTGLAADIEPESRTCEIEACFADTAEGKWLVENAYKYGFIIRYPADKAAVTGYEFEPWHVRYIGNDLALELHTVGIKTLEEYFNLPGGSSY
jgi:zinc D-Ala-D-Ala carboxypeptidase